MALVDDRADAFRRALTAPEREAALRMARAYGRIVARLQRDLDELMVLIEQATTRGVPVTPSWLFEQERYRILLAQAEAELRRYAVDVRREIVSLQSAAIDEASDRMLDMVLASLGPAPVDAVAAIQARFAPLNRGSLQELVGFLSDGSPLADLLSELAPTGRDAIEGALIEGVALGQHPTEIAAAFRKAAAVPLNRALTIARTEVIRAAREAAHQGYEQNADILRGWIWHSSLGLRTCISCIAMHGTIHSLDERLDDHPRGRCVPVPLSKSWAELGFAGIPDRRPQIERGVDWFARQTPEFQLVAMGPSKFEAYARGEVELSDFVGRRFDPRWGSMRHERSLVSIVGEREQRRLIELARAAD